MNTLLDNLEKIGIVPVVVIEKESDALPLAKALMEGGLPCAEVTFRTDAAKESIRLIAKEYPEMIVGAGTILTIEQAEQAILAGSKFIVSPGFNEKVVRYCQEKKIPIIPGCASPSEVEHALEMGLTTVKFFPAEQAGGLPMIQAMSAPYKNVRFMPTGGIDEKNIGAYLSEPKVIACGGSYMVKKDLIAQGKFDQITKLTKNAVSKMLEFRIEKVETCEQGQVLTASVANLKRAVYHLENQGIVFEKTETVDNKICEARFQSNSDVTICLVGRS